MELLPSLQHDSAMEFILAKSFLTHLPSAFINSAKMCFIQLLQGLFIASLSLSLITVPCLQAGLQLLGCNPTATASLLH